jgi:hypothetical protein
MVAAQEHWQQEERKAPPPPAEEKSQMVVREMAARRRSVVQHYIQHRQWLHLRAEQALPRLRPLEPCVLPVERVTPLP